MVSAACPSCKILLVEANSTSFADLGTAVNKAATIAPIVASVYVLSGNTAGYANAIPYSHMSSLFDVTAGSNGSCVTTQWCNARPGWDGPTGLGTPNGSAAF